VGGFDLGGQPNAEPGRIRWTGVAIGARLTARPGSTLAGVTPTAYQRSARNDRDMEERETLLRVGPRATVATHLGRCPTPIVTRS
jgi:hypothetical protein